MKEITIEHRKMGRCHPPFIVAEMSGNHNGILERALQLCEAAKKAGAHAIKIQTYTPDTITLNVKSPDFVMQDASSLWKGKNLYELYQEAYTPWEWHPQIFEKCRDLGLICFSTPFDETAVDFLETLHTPCYKIGSLEIVDLPLIQKAASTGKPLIISTGAASLEEIQEAVEAAKEAGGDQIILLKCNKAYPAFSKDCNLFTLPDMAARFNTLVGISDHTLGIGAAIASIALGGCLIEKHFTSSRLEGGVDSSFSMDEQEFKLLVEESQKAWESLGEVRYGAAPSEEIELTYRPSLFFVADLKAGETVCHEHIRSVRPNRGLPPKEIERVVGLKLKQPVSYGTPVRWDLF